MFENLIGKIDEEMVGGLAATILAPLLLAGSRSGGKIVESKRLKENPRIVAPVGDFTEAANTGREGAAQETGPAVDCRFIGGKFGNWKCQHLKIKDISLGKGMAPVRSSKCPIASQTTPACTLKPGVKQ